MIKHVSLILGLWLAVACAEQPTAGFPPPNSDLCPKMCAHLADLKCPEAEALYNNDLPGPPDVPNETCTMFCTEMQDKYVNMSPKCVLAVTSCDGIEPARALDPVTCAAHK